MISYFKYDSGHAFTKDGTPYTGFFYISGGKAYTGKSPSSLQVELSATSTFISDFYLNSLEFDKSFNNISTISYSSPNTFDIFDITSLDNNLEVLNRNNLETFKNLIVQNPTVFNINQVNIHFYGLSSTDSDSRNDDLPTAKNVYTHIDPFSYDSEWYFVDNIISGDFLLDRSDNFLYFCSDGQTQYTLRGSFSELDTLELLETRPSSIFYLKQDDVDRKIFMMGLTSIEIYDSSYFATGQNLNLVDIISISIFPENKELFKIGRNIRTEYVDGILYLKNKYSTSTISTISLDSLSADQIIALDLRESDDAMLLLSSKDGIYSVSLIDTSTNSFIRTEELSDSLGAESLFFSIQDSNLFYLTVSDDIQLRLISNMAFPVGSAKNSNYFYLNDYIYGTTDERFGNIQIKYNSNSLKSNFFNNILFKLRFKDNYQYLMTHNIGRVYVSKLSLDDNLLTAIPIDLEKSYNGISCSKSSIGLYLNSAITNIVKDTMKLYTLASHTISYNSGVLEYGAINDLNFEIENLYFHGNETINVVALQRIFYLIADIQRQLISTL